MSVSVGHLYLKIHSEFETEMWYLVENLSLFYSRKYSLRLLRETYFDQVKCRNMA